jgi:NAD(P)-dependent dehydrogenase (short-subunit alcohol dehydrogenase family)
MDDKHVIVIGASSGLGRSFALQASDAGAKVALISRRKPLLEELAQEINSNNKVALVLVCDIKNPNEVENAFAEIYARWGRFDIALNAAGVVDPLSAIAETDASDFKRSLDINVFGTFLCCREELRLAAAQNSPATVVNVSSGAAYKTYLNWAAYCSSKAAVDAITRIAAAEASANQTRVFAVSPGPFESHMQELMRNSSEQAFPAREKFIKLHQENKLPAADQVADATMRLAISDWPELSGMILDLRDQAFRDECLDHGIMIDY